MKLTLSWLRDHLDTTATLTEISDALTDLGLMEPFFHRTAADIDRLIAAGQQAYKALKYAPFPVVAAPAGMALGGGCEILLHADAIQAHAEKHRYGVVRDFCGHGLGRVFHAPPNVLHFGRPGKGPVLEEGMFFTIEPMINLGRPETKVLADDWTAVTRDKSLSAQFEHAIGVTADGCEIFTLSDKFFPEME